MNPETPSLQSARVVRVFISSTFRDMQAERDELVKLIFPQLRELCEQRSVTWTEVDLRWGLTDEQAAEGQVLPICLAEINNCRPYFIGILGERYGWIPESISPELIEREPWLAEHRSRSVTELEILHGVLNNPEMASHAYFYFRSPTFSATVSPDERSIFNEVANSEESARFGQPEADRRAAERVRKLAALKDRIRASRLALKENYPTPQSLGELVLQDLTTAIEREFPLSAEPSPLERDELEHEAFARTRSAVYVSRPGYFERLDAHLSGMDSTLVLLGESGAGKSALLANWVAHRSSPDNFVVMHFVGATPYSSDWAAMLRRIMGEFKRHFGIEQEVPDKLDQLRIEFANWLNIVGSKGRVVLIIDALNQLDDRDGALELSWLPASLPDNVRVIVSTLKGRPAEELAARGCPSLTVEPLSVSERSQLIVEYLAQYRKTLSAPRIDRIAAADQSANPLFLCALLEELRVYGDHFTLDQRINDYLSAPTISALYERILMRYEQDYERGRPGLVRDTMLLLWAARRGLSEVELLDLLGPAQLPLPRAFWSPLFIAAEAALVSRSGLIGFFHNYLRQAVEERYLATTEQKNAAHRRLAGYFSLQSVGPRKIDELPWQLAEAKEWQSLYGLLSDRNFFEAAWAKDPYSLLSYWARLEAGSPLRMTNAYQPPTETNADCQFANNVTSLLTTSGYLSEALALQKRLLDRFRNDSNPMALASVLGNTAGLLDSLGQTDEALKLLQEQERICSRINDLNGCFLSLRDQGRILFARKDLDGASILYREAERLSRRLGDKASLVLSLTSLAEVCFARKEFDQAQLMYREIEKLSQELGEKLAVANSLYAQAAIKRVRGELEGSLQMLERVEQIYREAGDKSALAKCLGQQGSLLSDRKEFERAITFCDESERLYRSLGNNHSLAQSLNRKAEIFTESGHSEKALSLHEEAIAISREAGNKQGVVAGLTKLMVALHQQGYDDLAMNAINEAEQISRELGDKELLPMSLGLRASLLRDLDRKEEALDVLIEEEQVCRAANNKEGLAQSIAAQAEVLHELQSFIRALPLYEEAEKLCREQGEKQALARCLGNHAVLLRNENRLGEALVLHQEEEELYRELGDEEGITRSFDNQLAIRTYQNSINDTMKALEDLKATALELGFLRPTDKEN